MEHVASFGAEVPLRFEYGGSAGAGVVPADILRVYFPDHPVRAGEELVIRTGECSGSGPVLCVCTV